MIFPEPEDCRFFLCLVACAVRVGWIRVHAYCLMGNHFHLLVESVDGSLSQTMKWILQRYARYINAKKGHPGHRFEGRFFSNPVTTRAYLFVLIRYIDRNPAAARRRTDPMTYTWGSARFHGLEKRRALWLSRDVVDPFVAVASHHVGDRSSAYARAFQLDVERRGERDLVEARIEQATDAVDDLDLLLGADLEGQREWLRSRARSGERPRNFLAVSDARSIRTVVAFHRVRTPQLTVRTTALRACVAWDVAEVGLLCDLGGLAWGATASLLGLHPNQVRSRYEIHRKAILGDDMYATILAGLVWDTLEECLGPGIRALVYDRRLSPSSRSREKFT